MELLLIPQIPIGLQMRPVQSKKEVFFLEEIKMIRDRISEINEVPIAEIDFERGGFTGLSEEEIEGYKLCGISTFYVLKSIICEIETNG